MKNISLLASTVLAATPLAVILSGCGGGNGLVTPTSTPVPTSTVTPVPTVTGSATPTATGSSTPIPTSTTSPQQTSNLTLGNGQKAVLRYRTSGTRITGTLQILASTSNMVKTRAITYTFAVGTYTITGTFTLPRGYNITGTLNGQPLFTMTGQLPTTTQTGSYTLTVDGQTESGIIPRIGDITPTATPRPTNTPNPTATGTSGTVTSTVTFTRSSDSNFVNVPITPTLNLISQSGFNTLGVGGSGTNSAGSSLLSITVPNPTTGKTYSIDNIFQASARLINTPGNTFPFYYSIKSGTVTVNSFTSTTASVTFNNVVFEPNEGTSATGTVTVKGTISGPYKKN